MDHQHLKDIPNSREARLLGR